MIRKAAVQKYGGGRLARIASDIAQFATGGAVHNQVARPETPKRNREVVETLQMIELGLDGMISHTNWLRGRFGGSVSLSMKADTMRDYRQRAQADRRMLEGFIGRQTLTGFERQNLERIRGTWRHAMSQALMQGKDLERDLIDFMEQRQGEFFRGGGIAPSDTIPAMLTPGEYVVNKDAVSRYGSGFFAAINNLSLPAQALARRVQGFAAGGLVQPAPIALARPVLADSAPVRTVRVELAADDRTVHATIDERDESRLLQLLDRARARAI